MNGIVVTLIATKPNELNKFLSAYYCKDMEIEESAFRWSCQYKRPLDSICILATLIDNLEDFKIEALVSVNHLSNIRVSKNNINELVKFFSSVGDAP